MTDHAYVALIENARQFDQVEDFVAALVREGAGYANDIGVLDAPNHFGKGTLLVLDPLKNEPRFRQVRLEVDPKTAQVLKSTVVDPDGNLLRIGQLLHP